MKVAKPCVVRTDICPTHQNTLFTLILWPYMVASFPHQAPAEHLLLEI